MQSHVMYIVKVYLTATSTRIALTSARGGEMFSGKQQITMR
jgi:hypothetical protein